MSQLPGSLNCHAHLFKLIQLLTYFTLKRQQKNAQITTKDILVKWFSETEQDSVRLSVGSDKLIDYLNDLTMSFVSANMYETGINIEKFNLSKPEDIKCEILNIINEYWLPF